MLIYLVYILYTLLINLIYVIIHKVLCNYIVSCRKLLIFFFSFFNIFWLFLFILVIMLIYAKLNAIIYLFSSSCSPCLQVIDNKYIYMRKTDYSLLDHSCVKIKMFARWELRISAKWK